MTGPVIVDDVIYENVDDDISRLFRSKELIFRRLIFERSMGLVQSEALLTGEGCKKTVSEKEQKKSRPSSKSRKRGNQKGNSSNVPPTNGNVSRSFVNVSVIYVSALKIALCCQAVLFLFFIDGGCKYLFLSCFLAFQNACLCRSQ